MKAPLADRIRPKSLDDVVGQTHILSKGKVLRNIIETGNVGNMIFYGPSGTGKTTVANIAAAKAGKPIYKLNATNASVSDIKSIVSDLEGFGNENGVILYLDEIQNFNKKQQQALLEFIENGRITLIASTTENPYFYIYNAILSRSVVFEFREISPKEQVKAVIRAADILKEEGLNVFLSEECAQYICDCSAGDVRKAINTLETAVLSTIPNEKGELCVSIDSIMQCTANRAMRSDKDGDSYYDLASAFQKSIRGSDPDAAVHYLARMLEAGDIKTPIRRMLVIAAEDIGLAYPQAISIVKACTDAAFELGLPEARLPLTEAVLLLANAPKSNSVINAIDAAMEDIRNGYTGDVPLHLKDAHYSGAEKLGRGIEYKYPHSYPNNYVQQQYLPDAIKNKKYYVAGNNKNEQATQEYWSKIKKK